MKEKQKYVYLRKSKNNVIFVCHQVYFVLIKYRAKREKGSI